MTAPTPTPAADDGLLAQLRRHAVMLALLGPVALMVGVRWWLQFRLERLSLSLPPELAAAGDPAGLLRTVALVVLGCAAFGLLAWWLVRKPGAPSPLQRKVMQGLLAAWVLLWLVGTAQAVRSHFNVQGLQPTRTETLRLVGLKVQPPSLRSLGGARLYLDWPAEGGLHTVTVEAPSEALLRQPPSVQVQLAPGRWRGWYVLGWAVPGADSAAAQPSAPAAQPTPPAPPAPTPAPSPAPDTRPKVTP